MSPVYRRVGAMGAHLDGVVWADAPIPPRSHECWAQSRYDRGTEIIERCACGGLRYDGYGPWIAQYEGIDESRIPVK